MKNETIPASSRLTKNKFVVVGVIVGVLILALVLFSGRQFVGKAIEAQSQTVNPVLEMLSGPVAAGSSSTIRLKAEVGTVPLTAATFRVSAPGLCSATSSATITDRFLGLLGQQDPQQAYTCANDVLNFDDGLIGGPKSGTVNLLDIQLTPAAVPVQFTFSKFDLFSDEHKFSPATTTAFTCEGNTCTAGAADTDLDDDGILNAVDNCPNNANANQANQDSDTAGDECDTSPCGANAALVSGSCVCDSSFVNTNNNFNNGCEGTTGGGCPTCQSLDDLFSAASQNKKESLCATIGGGTVTCPTPANVNLDYDADGNGIVNNDDIFIMKLAFRARDPNLEPQPNCGGKSQQYCLFNEQGYYICENLQFRLVSQGVPTPNNCGGNEILGKT